MARLDNPAGRLHALLTEFSTLQGGSSTRSVWASVLSVQPEDVPLELAQVAGLLPAITSAVERTDSVEQRASVAYYLAAWSRPVFAPTTALDGVSEGLVDDQSLLNLGSLAAYLSAAASEGDIPPAEQVTNARDELADLLRQVVADESIEVTVRLLLVDRLSDMVWALDHLHIKGPEGVKAASERLAGAILLAGPAAWEDGHAKESLSVVGRVWKWFGLPGDFQAALQGWAATLGMLGS